MSEANELTERFELALDKLVQRAIEELGYTPEQYQLSTQSAGALQGVKQLLGGPVSDDSLQLWARGRRDLTVEAVARNDIWKDLFSETEREIAEKRYTDWAFELSSVHLPEVGPAAEDSSESWFSPDDDIVWGEGLIEGVAVCDKLAQKDRWVEAGHRLSGGWALAHYRKHLSDCSSCTEKCQHLKRALDQFDRDILGCLRDLIPLCLECLKNDKERAKQLLSAEWKAAAFPFLPSEAEESGIAQDGWHNPWANEEQQLQDWFVVLKMRAAELCGLAGTVMLEYEETHQVDGNPWVLWRDQSGVTALARFVQGLSGDQYMAALTARNISLTSAIKPRRLV